MGHTWWRRGQALFVGAALLTSLLAFTVAAPVAAQPSCDGRLATITDNSANDQSPVDNIITGTDGPDVIVGTADDDVISGGGSSDRICGGLGEDDIFGDAGNDRLFGGSDGDRIFGGGGRDDLFGFGGDDELDGGARRDFIRGGDHNDTIYGDGGDDILEGNRGSDTIRGDAGNDRIDGGPAPDDCTQGPGSGPIRNCEKADLRVVVLCPTSAAEGSVTCKVRVTNLGPNSTSYRLKTGDNESKGGNTVSCSNEWETEQEYGKLAADARRTTEFTTDCEVTDSPPVIWFEAEVDGRARDPRPGNNQDDDSISFT